MDEDTQRWFGESRALIDHLISSHVHAEARMDRAEARMDRAEARMDNLERRLRFFVRAGVRELRQVRKTMAERDAVFDRRMEEITDKLNGLIGYVDSLGRRPQAPSQ
ncbi:MAG: hypothetical protein FJW37_07835 [Acidobacteria bacterium]|nr:hypothetical protein [Acidobacteriota bacterium]